MTDQLKHKVISGLLWRGTERIGTQAVQVVVAIILARLLPPQDFGTIAVVTVFIGFAKILVDSGFGMALVQKERIDDRDYSSAFYLNLGIALIACLICFIGAPHVAKFYHEEVLTGVLRLAALGLVVGVFSSIQQATMNREMRFKLSFRVSLVAVGLSGAVGITCAYTGFGVWSLVYSQLVGAMTTAILLWVSVSWRPQVLFSAQSIGNLFRFGSKYQLARMVTESYSMLTTALVGKVFSLASLAFYSRGFFFPSYIVTSVCTTIDGVLFPALASCQSDKERMRGILRRSVSTSTFLLFPMLVGLAVVAKPMITVLLSEKWLPAAPFLQISCLTVAFWPVLGINVQAINAIGRSDIFLKMEILNKLVAFAAFFVTLPYGVMAVVTGQAAHSVLMCLVCYPWINSRYLGYSAAEQMADIAPALGCALGMGAVTLPFAFLVRNPLALLIVQMTIGACVYELLGRFFRLRARTYLLKLLHEKAPGLKRWLPLGPAPAV